MVGLKISVIIPCFNIEQHLSKCIDSVLNQTYRDFELLLIDDGSTDTTLQICKLFQSKDDRIKVFTQPNKGVSCARNRGIAESQADFIMFIDGDDFIKPDYIDMHLANFTIGIQPISGFTHLKSDQAIENRKFKNALNYFNSTFVQPSGYVKLLGFDALGSPCLRVYEKKIIDQNQLRFDENLTYQEDLLFNLSYLKYVSQIHLLNYFGYFYVEHAVSSTTKFHKNFCSTEIIFNYLHQMIRSSDDELVVKEFIFQTVIRKIANVFHRSSTKTISEKQYEISQMFSSEYFNFTHDHLFRTNINIVLKTILKLKSVGLIFLYYKFKKLAYVSN